MKFRPPTRTTRKLRWLVPALLALFAPMLFVSSAADANETGPNDWVPAVGVSEIVLVDGNGSVLEDISGVAIDGAGGIYAVDNGERNIYCLTNVGTSGQPKWQAQVVNGSSLSARDIEGIAWVGGQEFVVAWEDRGSGTPSGLTQVTMSGLEATVTGNVDLPPIAESSTEYAGGAEGIASAGAPGQYWVVQEGLVVPETDPPVVQPTLYPVNLNNAAPVGGAIPLTAGLDSAGVAVEPGDDAHVWVISEADQQLRKFVATGSSAGAQVGSGLATQLTQPEGIAFSPDGVHMIVVGENFGQQSEIAIYAQSTSQAPPPAGNCDGPQTPCPNADIAVSPNPAMLGDEITVVVTVNECDPSVEITRTRIQIWNEEIDFYNSSTGGLIDVYEDLDTHTFVGEVIATGDSLISVNVTTWFETWNDDGTPGSPDYSTDISRETISIESNEMADLLLVQIRNQQTGRYLDAAWSKVVTETTGASLWNIVHLPNGNVHVINAADGTYLDIDYAWVGPVSAIAQPEFGSEWILRSHESGAFYITNADFETDTWDRGANLRTTYDHVPNSQVSTTTWSSSHTRWFIESPS